MIAQELIHFEASNAEKLTRFRVIPETLSIRFESKSLAGKAIGFCSEALSEFSRNFESHGHMTVIPPASNWQVSTPLHHLREDRVAQSTGAVGEGFYFDAHGAHDAEVHI